jgi:hypothetical protein
VKWPPNAGWPFLVNNNAEEHGDVCAVPRILEHMSSDASTPPNPADGLLPTLEVIEQQPLAQRAAAYAGLLDELSRQLDSAPPSA